MAMEGTANKSESFFGAFLTRAFSSWDPQQQNAGLGLDHIDVTELELNGRHKPSMSLCKIIAVSLATSTLHPIDCYSTQQQLGSQISSGNNTHKLLSIARARELYKGVSLSVLKNFANFALAFTLLPEVSKKLEEQCPPFYAKLASGFVTGTAQSVLMAPLKTAYTLQCDGQIKSILDLPLAPRTLFSGTSASIARNAIYWMLYPILDDALSKSPYAENAHAALIGGFAGLCATLVSYPADVASKLICANPDKSKPITSIFKDLTVADFYRGSPLVMFRMAVASAIASYISKASIFCLDAPGK